MDIGLNVIKINQVAEAMTGWTSEKAYGKQLDEVFDIIDEARMNSQKEIIRSVILTEDNDLEEVSGILLAKSQKKQIVTMNNSNIKNIYGDITGHVLTFRDITERRKKEKAIYYMTYHD